MIKVHHRYEPYPHHYTTHDEFTPEMRSCIRRCLKHEADIHGKALLESVAHYGWTTIHSTPKPQRDRFYVADPSALRHDPDFRDLPHGQEFLGYRIVAHGYFFNVTFGERGRVLLVGYDKRRKAGGFDSGFLRRAAGAMVMSNSMFDRLNEDRVFLLDWDNFEHIPTLKLWEGAQCDYNHAIQSLWPAREDCDPFAAARTALSTEDAFVKIDGTRLIVPRRHLLRALPFIYEDTEYGEALRDYIDTYQPFLVDGYPKCSE